ncbi:cupin domain-containing protein [candidate division WOR-3 bacterium]|nr:cupin domain-containing protein [candidate division WOR-3 bacterium]
MLVKRLSKITPFVAGDGSLLIEILHPRLKTADVRFSLAHATVKPKQKTRQHVLEHAEVYYILSGRGLMHVNDETEEISKDDTIYIPPGHSQFIENTAQEDIEFLCIVDPAWEPGIEHVINGEQKDTRR